MLSRVCRSREVSLIQAKQVEPTAGCFKLDINSREILMRVTEEYKRSGLFWPPSDPDKKVAGTLLISDGGKIQLELFSVFDINPFSLNQAHPGLVGRINGCLEGDGWVTLEGCWEKTSSEWIKSLGISGWKSVIHVHQAFIGAPYEEEKITFNSLYFSIDGLHEWLGIESIHRDHKDNLKSATITYERPENLIYKLENGFRLLIWFGVSLPAHGSPIIEARVIQKAYFRLEADTEQELSKFTDIAYKLTNFMCFAVDETVSLSEVTATSQKKVMQASEGKTHPIPIRVYYESLPFTEEKPKVNRMIFRFHDVEETFKEIIGCWLSAYEDISPTLNLYFSATTGGYRYLEGKFLALAQGLENLSREKHPGRHMQKARFKELVNDLISHCPETIEEIVEEEERDKAKEWLRKRLTHANEPSLRQRIRKLVEPFEDYFGKPEERENLIAKIVHTRNYYTHYSSGLEDKAAHGGTELLELCHKMEAIFQLNFMKLIGFSDAKVTSVLNRSYKLMWKLGLCSE